MSNSQTSLQKGTMMSPKMRRRGAESACELISKAECDEKKLIAALSLVGDTGGEGDLFPIAQLIGSSSLPESVALAGIVAVSKIGGCLATAYLKVLSSRTTVSDRIREAAKSSAEALLSEEISHSSVRHPHGATGIVIEKVRYFGDEEVEIVSRLQRVTSAFLSQDASDSFISALSCHVELSA